MKILTDVAVVTRNYNNYIMTSACIDEILNCGDNLGNIIVIDDCSSDGSFELLKNNYPNIIIFRMNKFSEYCKCFNQGIKIALARGANYIQIINNDIRNISQNFFEEMKKPFLTHNRVGLVGSRCYDYEKTILTSIEPKIRMGLYVDIPTEGYMFSRAVIEEVGLFDEKLVRHLEDYDYLIRLRLKGFSSKFCDKASFEHLGGGTSKKMFFVPNYYRMRNIVWYLKRYGFEYTTIKKLRISLGFSNKSRMLANKQIKAGNLHKAFVIYFAMFSGLFVGVFTKW